jgi:hypothetical protein
VTDNHLENECLEVEPDDGEFVGEDSDEDFVENISRYRKRILMSKKEKPLATKIMEDKNVTAVVDRLNISDRGFTMLFGTIAGVAGEDIDGSKLSRSSFQRERAKNRTALAEDARQEFLAQKKPPLIVHWDGKIMETYDKKQETSLKQDRHAVVVTGFQTEKLLGVPSITSGTGLNQAKVKVGIFV